MDRVSRATYRSIVIAANVAVAIAVVPQSALAQVSEAALAALTEELSDYAAELTVAAPCIYARGMVIDEDSNERFDEIWGRAGVVEAVSDIDDISEEQASELLAVFDDNYAPEFATDDIRELIQFCSLPNGEQESIVMQLLLFTGVGTPLDIRLDRAMDQAE